MGTYALIAAAVKADLEGIADIGVVLNSAPLPPFMEDWAEYVDTLTSVIGGQRVVRAWTVGFLGTKPLQVRRGLGSQKVLREIRFSIRGYLGRHHPDSEATFRDLIETVVAVLDTDLGLGGTVIEHDPVDVDLPANADAVLLGDVVCHYCEITLAARAEMTLPAI